MNEKYEIRVWQDDVYAVYFTDQYKEEMGYNNTDYEFKGTLEQVNAWLSLKEKGYNI